MKRLKISRLMDEYVDDEFFPQGGETADLQAVKDRVLAKAAPAQQKRMLRKKKVLLTAALAAVLVLLVGAGLPYIRHQLVSGELFFQQNADGSKITGFVHYGPPLLELEGGRLFFNQDGGQRIDITDLVSDETPYIFDGSDPDSGKTYYVIAGGTPGSYGWFEWVATPDPFTYEEDGPMFAGAEEGAFSTYAYYPYRWERSDDGELRADTTGGLFGNGTVGWNDRSDLPLWLFNAFEELGIPYRYVSYPQAG